MLVSLAGRHYCSLCSPKESKCSLREQKTMSLASLARRQILLASLAGRHYCSLCSREESKARFREQKTTSLASFAGRQQILASLAKDDHARYAHYSPSQIQTLLSLEQDANNPPSDENPTDFTSDSCPSNVVTFSHCFSSPSPL